MGEAIWYSILGIMLFGFGILSLFWSAEAGKYGELGQGGVVFGGVVCIVLGLLGVAAGISRINGKK